MYQRSTGDASIFDANGKDPSIVEEARVAVEAFESIQTLGGKLVDGEASIRL